MWLAFAFSHMVFLGPGYLLISNLFICQQGRVSTSLPNSDRHRPHTRNRVFRNVACAAVSISMLGYINSIGRSRGKQELTYPTSLNKRRIVPCKYRRMHLRFLTLPDAPDFPLRLAPWRSTEACSPLQTLISHCLTSGAPPGSPASFAASLSPSPPAPAA